MVKAFIKEILIISIISVILAFIVNSLRTQGLPLFESAPRPLAQTNDHSTADSVMIKEISIEEAIDGFTKGKFLFADARSEKEYKSGHIKGALNLPAGEFDDWVGSFLETTDPEANIITYCEGYYCTLAKELAQKLIMAGFENVYYLPDGWGNWNKNRMPVETE
ncbi:MAG: rhodanese-like domain-containing protein [Deltaproteobacteria bacterium]|nr:MAG: rhodanese-like domain-containing protein [Deltaproteobacteria bacterium]